MASEPQGFGIGQGLLAELPKALAAGALALLGLAWRGLAKHRRERAAERELLHASAEAARRTADSMRWLLYVMGPGRGALTEDQLTAATAERRLELGQAASRVWQAMGGDERRSIRTTQELLAQPQDVIAEGEEQP